ncbi:uncharacterized protein BDW47DRAFT_133780 [Aspergillus candidus]|uniref:Uncharacterized protein n=1 Tax=Aspergillus candidus TaxID=41067 RepID=A0A2I2F3I8_ASPCN|nr:hypothetical protein BDW47DRAFT_133780 [Aspergillus candidus]PLB35179.1 hypothetical protein BDW47DRAFT_133780 [Aspergillus candidus]
MSFPCLCRDSLSVDLQTEPPSLVRLKLQGEDGARVTLPRQVSSGGFFRERRQGRTLRRGIDLGFTEASEIRRILENKIESSHLPDNAPRSHPKGILKPPTLRFPFAEELLDQPARNREPSFLRLKSGDKERCRMFASRVIRIPAFGASDAPADKFQGSSVGAKIQVKAGNVFLVRERAARDSKDRNRTERAVLR